MSDEYFRSPTDEDLATCQKHLQTTGLKGYLAFLEQKLEKWRQVPLNVGVIGSSGVGKSSFINAIRRLTADDEGGAPVGSTETTTEIQAYPHPKNAQLKFWDLPGVGTPKYPKDGYLECIGFERFDFFLLLSATRFTENDAWLGREITEKKKSYYYVRTKIEDDIRSSKRAHPKTFDESKELDNIRATTRSLLRNDSTPMFLIDNYEEQKYDFNLLEKQLIVHFPKLKQSALVLSVSAFSIEVIKLKVVELRSRIWKMSCVSCLGALIPIPGTSIVFNGAVVFKEALFYKEQLGLNDKSLEHLAKRSSTDVQLLRESVPPWLLQTTTSTITAFIITIPALASVLTAEETFGLLPLIGSFIAAPLAYKATDVILNKLLDAMEKVAVDVIECAFQPKN